MKKLLLALCLVGCLRAASDCSNSYEFTNIPGQFVDNVAVLNPGVTATIVNTSRVCTYWSFVYSSQGFSALTIALQSSTDNNSWSTFAGTTVLGSNPSTSTTVSTYTANGYYPFLRINLSATTGTGNVKVTLNGWLNPGGGVSTSDTNWTRTGTTISPTTAGDSLAISNIVPTADFTITQNAVVPFTSVASGAVANMLYLSGGKVGIGTTGPANLLDVNGNADVQGKLVIGQAGTIGTSVYGPSPLNVYAGSGVAFNAAATYATFGNTQLVDRGLEFGQTGGVAYIKSFLNRGNGGGLVLNPTSGNVGIGFVSPVYSLDVSGGVGETGTARFFDQTATTGTTLVTITPGAAQTSASVTLTNGGSSTTMGTITAFNSAFTIIDGGGGTVAVFANPGSTNALKYGYGYFRGGSNTTIGFAADDPGTTSTDSAVSRVSAGVIGVGTGAVGSTAGSLRAASYQSVGTTYTLSTNTCSGTSLVGGATAGTFVSGTTGTCTVIITMGSSATAPTGWNCTAQDRTTVADLIHQTASTTTTASLSGTTITNDVIVFSCIGY